MNKLQKAMANDIKSAGKMKPYEQIEYLGTGSIIAFSNVKEDKCNCDLHGSLPAKLYVIVECIRTFANEYDAPIDEVLDAIQFIMMDDDEPF